MRRLIGLAGPRVSAVRLQLFAPDFGARFQTRALEIALGFGMMAEHHKLMKDGMSNRTESEL
jgi:hypothetical protein